jgi:release factor glutamine methyltransferase
MRIDAHLAAATRKLESAGIEEAALDARLLLQHLTALSRSALILHGGDVLDAHTAARYRRLIERRSQRIPLQHLTGVQEFWSLEFAVSAEVLIPRPETEFLLEQVLATCPQDSIANALDLCTGSGVIAVVLARELLCAVTAVDLSPAALAVAAVNIARHQVHDRVTLICGDLFAALNPARKFDLIVSNPPYIKEAMIDQLEPEVAKFEPRLALSGGQSGLAIIEQIAFHAPQFLRPGGWLFVEIGADQGEVVHRLFDAPGQPYRKVTILDDWAGRPRVLRACYLPRE